MIVSCPSCKRQYNVADNKNGQIAKCHCGHRFLLCATAVPFELVPLEVEMRPDWVYNNAPQQIPPPIPAQRTTEVARGAGMFGIVMGLYSLYHSITMNTSVETAYGSVNNLGLMHQQQMWLLGGFGALIFGALVVIFVRK